MDKKNHKAFAVIYSYIFACFYCIYDWTVDQGSKEGCKGVDGRIIYFSTHRLISYGL